MEDSNGLNKILRQEEVRDKIECLWTNPPAGSGGRSRYLLLWPCEPRKAKSVVQ